MKKIILITHFLVVIAILCHAQDPEFYGMTYNGGEGGVGSIFKIDGTGAAFNSDFSFYAKSSTPAGNVIQAYNGLLYGMTSAGGIYGGGTIFSYDTSTGTYTDVYNFGNGTDGRIPFGSLIEGSDSLLYGMTSRGGTSPNYGVIFSYNISTGTETVLHNFAYGTTDAATPNGSLVQVNDSMLYGMAKFGGPHTSGIIFSYNIHTGVETDLHNFGSNNDGNSPLGSLILANNGLLYGLAQDGGNHDGGMMFSFDPATNSETDIHDFTGAEGAGPFGSLVQANNGLLYGLTSAGGAHEGGTIFSFDISNDTLTDLHDFGNKGDGDIPNGSLIQVNDSMLYGMTQFGGVGNFGENGVIFSYSITEDTEIVLHNFNLTDGEQPLGDLFQSSNGLLYGMTSKGGSQGAGVLLSYNITGDTEMVLHNFGIDTDGNLPNGSLIKATNSLYYGLTQNGGLNNVGSIFSYNPATGTEKDLYDFGTGSDGQLPFGSLVQADDSLMFGMTSAGGASNDGIIFKFNILTGHETMMQSFNGTNGISPYGSFIKATNGLLYGMTLSNIFSYNIVNNVFADLHDFGNGNDGAYPYYNSLLQVNDSMLYGTTSSGGTKSDGTIFSYTISTGTETVLYNFGGVLDQDGNAPFGTLCLAGNGLLYGTTYAGSKQDLGALFSYDISTGVEKILVSLNGTDGQNPSGGFIKASNGLLYATTSKGGTDNDGTVISFDISTGKENAIHTFSGIDGDNPNGNLLEVDTFGTTGISQLPVANTPLIIYPNPTIGQFTIKLNDNQNGYTLEIYNIMGELVYQSVLNNFLNSININSPAPGLYFAYLKSANGVEVSKIIVTR